MHVVKTLQRNGGLKKKKKKEKGKSIPVTGCGGP
jgi:hypothetical protein